MRMHVTALSPGGAGSIAWETDFLEAYDLAMDVGRLSGYTLIVLIAPNPDNLEECTSCMHIKCRSRFLQEAARMCVTLSAYR